MPNEDSTPSDPWSAVVIGLTLLLFVVSVFVKGFTHELLLEAGVFLVSVKLILMAQKNSVSAKVIGQRLERIATLLERIQNRRRLTATECGGVYEFIPRNQKPETRNQKLEISAALRRSRPQLNISNSARNIQPERDW